MRYVRVLLAVHHVITIQEICENFLVLSAAVNASKIAEHTAHG
jgi:hypothetical protein